VIATFCATAWALSSASLKHRAMRAVSALMRAIHALSKSAPYAAWAHFPLAMSFPFSRETTSCPTR
jgi:hypothetical protein